MSTATHAEYNTPLAWASGPGPVYDRLASWLVDAAPAPLAGLRVLDLGAGTGALSQACVARGARPVAADLSLPMLKHAQSARPPAVCADATALPFTTAAFDAVVAGFSLTHVDDVDRAVSECRRVLVSGGALLASAFTRRYPHAAQAAVEEVLADFGWDPPDWYLAFKDGTDAALTDPLRFLDVACDFSAARVIVARVDTGIATPDDLVRWRLGMPNCTSFLATLPADRRRELHAAALSAVAPVAGPLRPEVTALVAIR